VSAAGISRFGDRIERGPAASFRCARCGEVAFVRVARTGATVNMGQARFSLSGASGAC
jgi:hypothetical protein